ARQKMQGQERWTAVKAHSARLPQQAQREGIGQSIEVPPARHDFAPDCCATAGQISDPHQSRRLAQVLAQKPCVAVNICAHTALIKSSIFPANHRSWRGRQLVTLKSNTISLSTVESVICYVLLFCVIQLIGTMMDLL